MFHHLLTLVIAAALILSLAGLAPAEDERWKEHRGKIETLDRAGRGLGVRTALGLQNFTLSPQARIHSRDGAEWVGQLEELPPVSAADTATVVATNTKERVVSVATPNGPANYRIAETTAIEEDGRRLEIDELEVGERVAITAERAGDELVATTLTVVADPH